MSDLGVPVPPAFYNVRARTAALVRNGVGFEEATSTGNPRAHILTFWDAMNSVPPHFRPGRGAKRASFDQYKTDDASFLREPGAKRARRSKSLGQELAASAQENTHLEAENARLSREVAQWHAQNEVLEANLQRERATRRRHASATQDMKEQRNTALAKERATRRSALDREAMQDLKVAEATAAISTQHRRAVRQRDRFETLLESERVRSAALADTLATERRAHAEQTELSVRRILYLEDVLKKKDLEIRQLRRDLGEVLNELADDLCVRTQVAATQHSRRAEVVQEKDKLDREVNAKVDDLVGKLEAVKTRVMEERRSALADKNALAKRLRDVKRNAKKRDARHKDTVRQMRRELARLAKKAEKDAKKLVASRTEMDNFREYMFKSAAVEAAKMYARDKEKALFISTVLMNAARYAKAQHRLKSDDGCDDGADSLPPPAQSLRGIVKYDAEIYELALLINIKTGKRFERFAEILGLPSARALRARFRVGATNQGVMEDSIAELREALGADASNRGGELAHRVIISFDSCAIKEHVHYSVSTRKIIGFDDSQESDLSEAAYQLMQRMEREHGAEHVSPGDEQRCASNDLQGDAGEQEVDDGDPATHYLVFYATSLSHGAYKMPVMRMGKKDISPSFLARAWAKLERSLNGQGLRTAVLVSDAASENVSFFGLMPTVPASQFLDGDELVPSALDTSLPVGFRHPYHCNQVVFTFPDPPHLLKSLRNAMANRTLVIPSCGGGTLTLGLLKNIFSFCQHGKKNALQRWRQMRVEYFSVNRWSKMSVTAAARVQSGKMLEMIQHYEESHGGTQRDCEAAKWWVARVNQAWDLWNSQHQRVGGQKRNAGIQRAEELEPLLHILADFERWGENVKGAPELDAAQNFLAPQTLASLRSLTLGLYTFVKYSLPLLDGCGIFVRNISSDICEHHFGVLRSKQKTLTLTQALEATTAAAAGRIVHTNAHLCSAKTNCTTEKQLLDFQRMHELEQTASRI